jgi:hypothetical protein
MLIATDSYLTTFLQFTIVTKGYYSLFFTTLNILEDRNLRCGSNHRILEKIAEELLEFEILTGKVKAVTLKPFKLLYLEDTLFSLQLSGI